MSGAWVGRDAFMQASAEFQEEERARLAAIAEKCAEEDRRRQLLLLAAGLLQRFIVPGELLGDAERTAFVRQSLLLAKSLLIEVKEY